MSLDEIHQQLIQINEGLTAELVEALNTKSIDESHLWEARKQVWEATYHINGILAYRKHRSEISTSSVTR